MESAVQRPHASAGGQEAYPTIFDKTGALMHSLIQNHAFVDGNKRIGFAAAILFLQLNGRQLSIETSEIVEFCVRVARGRLNAAQIAEWLSAHAKSDHGR